MLKLLAGQNRVCGEGPCICKNLPIKLLRLQMFITVRAFEPNIYCKSLWKVRILIQNTFNKPCLLQAITQRQWNLCWVFSGVIHLDYDSHETAPETECYSNIWKLMYTLSRVIAGLGIWFKINSSRKFRL